jgi:OPA family glycerol-3-phosphate transporter-like MFS transporter/OPA family sugar phosphate sensor protein UhpC-like MFS transporter
MSVESEAAAISSVENKSPAIGDAAPSSDFSYWQTRTLIATMIGYALFYFVRKNISVAMPMMEEQGIASKIQLGTFLTAHGLLYGVSKFINGVIGDRANARWFMTTGLVVCAVINLFFGLSASIMTFGILWMLNGWFQGMGFPPCARLMTHWFPPSRLASKMAIWNISHSLGAGLIFILCGYLVGFGWRLCFFVPAGIVLVGAAWLAVMMRDTPESLGFPPVEGTQDLTHSAEPLGSSLQRLVFANPQIWLLSFANFFVYVVRYGIMDWGPTFLKQARGIELTSGTWMVAAFEVAGMLGMLFGGWITDRLFGGRAARACLVYMTFCTGATLLFWRLPGQTPLLSTALLCVIGFFIYGPQSLIGTAAANLATKRAAAAAVGLTSVFGYLSTTVSGVGIGAIAETYEWNTAFMIFPLCGIIGMLLFACCWRGKAHGYEV